MVGALAAVAVAAAAVFTPAAQSARSEHALLEGATSIDVLVARFLDALGTKDRQALRALRVTREEYDDLILPGSDPEGQPLREWPNQVNDYFWSVLHTKSAYSEDNILAAFGGCHYTVKSIGYRKGTQKFAAYTAYRQLQVVVRDDEGVETEIRTGSVAEVNGRYKFISFIRD